MSRRWVALGHAAPLVGLADWRAVPGSKGFDWALLNADGTLRPAYRELNRGIGRLTPRP